MSIGNNSRDEFRQWNLLEWDKVLKAIFPFAVPLVAHWKNTSDIIAILNKVGSIQNLNHTFKPSGGGQDLSDANEASEFETIALRYGGIGADIIRPSGLFFHSFYKWPEWSYFRLETGSLMPSKSSELSKIEYEELTEIEPGHYVERSAWDQGYYYSDEDDREIALPNTARPVMRHFRGAFVIFAKGSPYNAVHGTYDARHNKMNDDDFRQYIAESIKMLESKGHTSAID